MTPETTVDGHFPLLIDSEYEDQLLDLCVSDDFEPKRWLRAGPSFFMAGLAVILASLRDKDCFSLLTLAERLYPGVSEVIEFNEWVDRAPLRVAHFLSLVDARMEEGISGCRLQGRIEPSEVPLAEALHETFGER